MLRVAAVNQCTAKVSGAMRPGFLARCTPGFGRDAPRVSASPQPGLPGVCGSQRCQLARVVAIMNGLARQLAQPHE